MKKKETQPKKVKKVEVPITVSLVDLPPVIIKSEKDKLLELYQQLKDLGINSIGDLEVKISRL